MANLISCDGALTTGESGEPLCSVAWVQIDSTQTELLVSGGFDTDAFMLAFNGVFLLWAIGLSVGLIVGIIRKTKKG